MTWRVRYAHNPNTYSTILPFSVLLSSGDENSISLVRMEQVQRITGLIIANNRFGGGDSAYNTSCIV